MLNQSPLIDELARERIADIHDSARRERLAGRAASLPRTRAHVGQLLIALGQRLAPTETRATNRMTKPAGR